MWQELRTELRPQGVEVVTVALDTGGADAAGQFIDAAAPEHPSVIDAEHRLDELLGITNVPMGVWIDEEGILVRPPETAHPGKSVLREMMRGQKVPEDLPAYVLAMLAETAKIRVKPERYAEALRDWAAKGAESEYALSPGRSSSARGRARPSCPRPRPTSSSASTCTAPATSTRPARTSARPTASTRRTGPTAARPGRSRIPSRGRASTTTRTGSAT